jgi:hypothetical protein
MNAFVTAYTNAIKHKKGKNIKYAHLIFNEFQTHRLYTTLHHSQNSTEGNETAMNKERDPHSLLQFYRA